MFPLERVYTSVMTTSPGTARVSPNNKADDNKSIAISLIVIDSFFKIIEK